MSESKRIPLLIASPDQLVAPYCVLSFEAVAALRARGYLVHRLEDGYPEWKAAGLPIESVA
jgi:rhodanese-related sulfurtransferase